MFVAALSAYWDPMKQVSIGANGLVVVFLKGALCLNPTVWVVCTQWDLRLVMDSLCSTPYEVIEQADIRSFSMKTAFLLAITSVEELHALSVSLQCLRWGPEGNQVTLWPNPAFQPKVLSPQFIN